MLMRAATVVQVSQDLFYVLLHILFYLWSLLKTSSRTRCRPTPASRRRRCRSPEEAWTDPRHFRLSWSKISASVNADQVPTIHHSRPNIPIAHRRPLGGRRHAGIPVTDCPYAIHGPINGHYRTLSSVGHYRHFCLDSGATAQCAPL